MNRVLGAAWIAAHALLLPVAKNIVNDGNVDRKWLEHGKEGILANQNKPQTSYLPYW